MHAPEKPIMQLKSISAVKVILLKNEVKGPEGSQVLNGALGPYWQKADGPAVLRTDS